MPVTFITVGKLKEAYLRDGIAEYTKRLQRFGKVTTHEVADERLPDQPSATEKTRILTREGDKILSKITAKDFVVVLAVEGKLVTSEDLSQHIAALAYNGFANLTYVIGGSLGLSPAVKQRANALVSFGRITLPHQLMRLVTYEQVYRAHMIHAGSTYHK